MGIFDREKDFETPEGEISGFLAEGTAFEGVLVFEGTVRIDGKLTGKIICKPQCTGTLIVGETGHVESDLIVTDNLLVSGKFLGKGPVIALDVADFRGDSKIEIQKNYALYASRIIIKNKSLFQGKSVMIRHEAQKTKEQIKSLIFENKNQQINIPFEPNPLLKGITEK